MDGYYDLEVSLADIKPRIWRRFLISSNATFAALHDAIQDAFGWEDMRLWAFQEPGRRGEIIAGVPDPEWDDGKTPDAWKIRLHSYLGRRQQRCVYVYDYGDRWQHNIELKATLTEGGDF